MNPGIGSGLDFPGFRLLIFPLYPVFVFLSHRNEYFGTTFFPLVRSILYDMFVGQEPLKTLRR